MTLDDLLKYAPLFQIVAYTSLTLSTIIVGVAALIFTYRNNFGWKPLCIVLSHGAGTPPSRQYIDATLHFEIWNRHKYPIALRELKIEYPFYWLTEGANTGLGSEWVWRGNSAA